MPRDAVQKVHAAAVRALNDPEIRKRLSDGGSFVDGGTPEQFARLIQRELAQRKEIVRKQNIKLE